ncbi:MAG: hypothetical protein PHU25_04185 [Deltaproteobacteria bacterium]|nr:hypothetical protein [Deltaproteobacteria bacterium]
MQDGPGLFGSAEFKDPRRIAIACGENPQFLFPTSSYYATFRALKGGIADAVVFGAFVGVPYDPATPGPDQPCEGPGNRISGCLDDARMQHRIVAEGLPDGGSIETYAPVCTRGPDDAPLVKARPGRRYVELATANPPDGFGAAGYVSSICNPDWSPAMRDIAKLIAAHFAPSCWVEPMDWDPATKTAKCDVVAELILGVDKAVTPTSCPWKATPITKKITNETTGREETRVFCPLPKLPADLDCSLAETEISQDDMGWYYCENFSESSEDACRDGVDNDRDGMTDCDDEGCRDCPRACGDAYPEATGIECLPSCMYNARMTDAAKQAVRGESLLIGCLTQVSDCDGGAS